MRVEFGEISSYRIPRQRIRFEIDDATKFHAKRNGTTGARRTQATLVSGSFIFHSGMASLIATTRRPPFMAASSGTAKATRTNWLHGSPSTMQYRITYAAYNMLSTYATFISPPTSHLRFE